MINFVEFLIVLAHLLLEDVLPVVALLLLVRILVIIAPLGLVFVVLLGLLIIAAEAKTKPGDNTSVSIAIRLNIQVAVILEHGLPDCGADYPVCQPEHVHYDIISELNV